MDHYSPGGVPSVVWEAQYVKDKEGGWVWGNHREASKQQMAAMQRMVRSHKQAFAYSLSDLPGYQVPVSVGQYTGKPAYSRPKQYSPAETKVIQEKFKELRDAGLIRKVGRDNPFASRPTVAAKRDATTGEWTDHRFCVNYVALNKGTATDPYPLPLPEAMFRQFGKAKFFTKIDCRAGFHQLVLDLPSQERSAFWVPTPDGGQELWAYCRLPFGMKNSSAIFQRVMDTVLGDAGLRENAGAFVDDVLIWSDTPEQHIQHVQAVLQAMHGVGLRAHPDKSIFMAEGVEYLGHVVSPLGLQPAEARVAAFKQLNQPRTKEELRSQLGMLGFYRCYLPHYSSIADPLRKFLKQAAPSLLQWDEETVGAYQGLVEGLTTEGLCLRRVDPKQPFVLHTDWSTKGLGAVLTQLDDQGREGMVACISRSLNVHEARYPAWKGELLAVVWAAKHFKPYLAGRDFTVVTDHRPLLWLMTTPELSGQQERWVLALQDFSFTVEHRPGVSNPADVPSRYPQPSAADTTGARLDEEGSMQRVLPRVRFDTEAARLQAITEFVEGTYVAEPGLAAALLQFSDHPVFVPGLDAAAAEWQLRQQLYVALPPVASAVAACVSGTWDLGAEELWNAGEITGSASADQSAAINRQYSLQHWTASMVRQGLGRGQGLTELGVSGGFFRDMSRGIVVIELFGGLCAGLEACLRNGWAVRQYIYVDKDPAVRQVAAYRLACLMAQYPEQLSHESCRMAFSFWPQDVYELRSQHLQQLQGLGGPCLVWAGWECQDLSPAGAGRGLQGLHSHTFYPLHSILQQLQHLLGPQLGWVLENTAVDVPWQSHQQALVDLAEIKATLGEPLVVDAAQFGSRAHRLRYFWTNLAPHSALQQLLQQVHRPPGLLVRHILGPGRSCQPVRWDDCAPFYPCNRVGQPRQALPTLVATVGSHAFRDDGPGCIYDTGVRGWTEPTVEERELALGYTAGITAAPGVSDLVRHQVTGRCMDANTVMVLLALCHGIQQSTGAAVQGGSSAAPAAQCTAAGGSSQQGGSAEGMRDYRGYLDMQAAAAIADQQEERGKDIWDDVAAMQFLQTGSHGDNVSRQDRSRIAHRARLYTWQQQQLWRRMPNGTVKLVPKPEEREGIISRIHEQTGHYGVRRTAHMVLSGHWWRTLHTDVAQFVGKCGVCDRVRSSFNSLQPELMPLPIEPMFYRWGFDLAGEFPETARGFKWVLIGVEHFSKHIELIPLRNKTAEETAAAAAEVFCRFAAPAEVVTDGGGEWEGAFEELLDSCFIDHRVTSPNHPQANGLSERVVQVLKQGLRKLCETRVTTQWDKLLPWVALGYRCSKQASTKFSPYFLLYAREPVFPSSVRPKFEEVVDFDSAEAAQQSILQRAELLRRAIPIAADNLKAAQHRDTLRYQKLRSGGYLPKVADFRPGDFVYLKRPKEGSSLAIKARPLILKVKEVRPAGVVELQDKAGKVVVHQVSQLAPCHLPDIDGTIDRTLQGVDMEAECRVCGLPDDEAQFMFCDHCNTGWHTYCCTPPLTQVPGGHFLCEVCRAEGITLQDLSAAEQQRQNLQQQEGMPDLFPLADKRRRDQASAELHGRLILKEAGGETWWGRVNFKGPFARPRYFRVEYGNGQVEDGLTTYMVTKGKAYHLQPEGAKAPRRQRVPVALPVPEQ
jgi:hypothetical protein